MQRNPSSASSSGKQREREVTDPVTHLPLTIHDNTSVELEQIPPREPASFKPEISEKKDDSNERHAAMESLVHDVIHQGPGWWKDPREDENKRRVQTALVAGVATGVGGIGSFGLFSLLGRGGAKFEWSILFMGSLGCLVMALATTAFVLFTPALWEAQPIEKAHEVFIPS